MVIQTERDPIYMLMAEIWRFFISTHEAENSGRFESRNMVITCFFFFRVVTQIGTEKLFFWMWSEASPICFFHVFVFFFCTSFLWISCQNSKIGACARQQDLNILYIYIFFRSITNWDIFIIQMATSKHPKIFLSGETGWIISPSVGALVETPR